MKRCIALLLAILLMLTGCVQQSTISSLETDVSLSDSNTNTDNKISVSEEDSEENKEEKNEKESVKETAREVESEVPNFTGLNDPDLLQYIEDDVHSHLESQLSDDYIIENITAVYVSKEYLEELAFNSKSNIFFGYTLKELDEQFEGTRYVFTLGDNGETTVQPFEAYDDTYEKVVRNVAVGTGVILVCVTVSVATGGAGAVPVSVVFSASAKTATSMALSSGVIGGVAEGIVTGIKTKDFDKSVKAAALKGSEGFMWGAISGALVGGVSKASSLRDAKKAAEITKNVTKTGGKIPTPEEAEDLAMEYYKIPKNKQQVSYLNGKEVKRNTPGSTRPDLVRWFRGRLEAVEVKRYDLNNPDCVNKLYAVLKKQVTDRANNLPPGSTQRICLDVRGREIPEEVIKNVVQNIQTKLADIYPNIPIDIMR